MPVDVWPDQTQKSRRVGTARWDPTASTAEVPDCSHEEVGSGAIGAGVSGGCCCTGCLAAWFFGAVAVVVAFASGRPAGMRSEAVQCAKRWLHGNTDEVPVLLPFSPPRTQQGLMIQAMHEMSRAPWLQVGSRGTHSHTHTHLRRKSETHVAVKLPMPPL
eukprot:COSAG01_NODE_14501_length_1446_cov_0.959169_2_plen_160_part_00